MTTPDAGQRLIEDLRKCARESTSMYVTSVALAAADEIERLRGVEADARRYRFIRSGETHGDVDVNIYRHPWFTEEFDLLTEDAADTVIDAAIAASRDAGEDHG